MRYSLLSLAVLVMLASLGESANGAEKASADGWRYVTTASGDAFEQPPLRALRLSKEKPDDLTESVDYRGHTRLYAQIRYGTPNSIRVVVVVDELGKREFDLYVGLNRNRIIQSKELISGAGRIRRTALQAEIKRDFLANYLDRAVIFRRGITRSTLGFASLGYLEGAIRFGGGTVKVRRVDGDGNGFFTDSRDRIWIDLNEDGTWDAFNEQFPFKPVLRLNGKRYSLRSDAFGSRLAVEEIVGVGTVKLELRTLQPKAHVLELSAMLIGEDGSAFALRGGDRAVLVPVGRYAVGTVTLSVESPETSLPWRFVFSRTAAPAEGNWYEVKKDGEVVVDPIGKLRFVLEMKEADANVAAGDSITINPRLYTGDGLLINSCGSGELRLSSYENSRSAIVQLTSTDSNVLSSARSGFS